MLPSWLLFLPYPYSASVSADICSSLQTLSLTPVHMTRHKNVQHQLLNVDLTSQPPGVAELPLGLLPYQGGEDSSFLCLCSSVHVSTGD